MTMISSYPLLEKFKRFYTTFYACYSLNISTNSLCQDIETQKVYESWSNLGCFLVVESDWNLDRLTLEPIFLNILGEITCKLDEIRYSKIGSVTTCIKYL